MGRLRVRAGVFLCVSLLLAGCGNSPETGEENRGNGQTASVPGGMGRYMETVYEMPEEINRNIRQQMYFWFGLPVLTALISSAGVLAYLIWSSYRTIVAYISLAQIGFIFAGVYIVFLLILGCYFTATYISVCASVLQ